MYTFIYIYMCVYIYIHIYHDNLHIKPLHIHRA